MFGKLGWYVDRYERFYNKVGPEDVHDFERAHHEYHEGIWELKNTILVLSQGFVTNEQSVESRDDANTYEKHNSVYNPSYEAMSIKEIEELSWLILEILNYWKITLYPLPIVSPKSL